MANINVILNSASIQVLDQASSTYRINTPVGTVTLSANTAAYDSFALIAAGGGTVLDLPQTTVWAAYVKNLDAVANLTVQIQVTGGALQTAANSPVLTPGGVWMYFNPSEGAGGIIAVTVVSSVANSPAEILLAG